MAFCVAARCLSLTFSPLSVIELKIDEVLQLCLHGYDLWVMISIIGRVTASAERDSVCCRC